MGSFKMTHTVNCIKFVHIEIAQREGGFMNGQQS